MGRLHQAAGHSDTRQSQRYRHVLRIARPKRPARSGRIATPKRRAIRRDREADDAARLDAYLVQRGSH
jgi:hypothetical protein